MNREEFYEQASRLDEAALRKALWTLYWRGNASVQERIEAQLEPEHSGRRRKQEQQLPQPDDVLREVRDFVALARSGSYLHGDRRVSPKERSRWRMTFRRLAKDAQTALQADDVDTAASALELMIDLATETRELDLFRSQDPVQAAGFVVSEAAGVLWSRYQHHHGFRGFAERAAPQLIRWESPHGWTRYGFGSVAEKEDTLATVMSGLLVIPDHWVTFTECYLAALDAAAAADEAATKRHWRSREAIRADRADSLAAWHELLKERLQDTEGVALMDRLAAHRALAGSE